MKIPLGMRPVKIFTGDLIDLSLITAIETVRISVHGGQISNKYTLSFSIHLRGTMITHSEDYFVSALGDGKENMAKYNEGKKELLDNHNELVDLWLSTIWK